MKQIIKQLLLSAIVILNINSICQDFKTMPADVQQAYEKRFLISSGSFGEIFSLELENKMLVAKRSIIQNPFAFKEFEAESGIIDALSSRYEEFFDKSDQSKTIPEYLGCFIEELPEEKRRIIIIMEKLDYSLFDKKFKRQLRSMKTPDRLSLYLKIVSKFTFMHIRRIAHCDIKLENLMWSVKDQDIKIIDFGSGVHADLGYCRGGTKGISPPEMAKDLQLGFLDRLKYDVFALVVSIYDLEDPLGQVYKYIKEESQTGFKNELDLFNPIVKGMNKLTYYLPKDHPNKSRVNEYNEKLFNLFRNALRYNPKERLSLYQVIKELKFLADESKNLEILVEEHDRANNFIINQILKNTNSNKNDEKNAKTIENKLI